MRSPSRRLRTALAVTAATAATTASLIGGSGVAAAALPPGDLHRVTDQYLYSTPLPEFSKLRQQRPHANQLDWSSDGCSHAPGKPLGYDFLAACQRHDFGYRNYKQQHRFTKNNRKRIDDNFRRDMYGTCGPKPDCRAVADVYYRAVRRFGGSTASTGDALDRAGVHAAAQRSSHPPVGVDSRR